jgi:hypothetical protein
MFYLPREALALLPLARQAHGREFAAHVQLRDVGDGSYRLDVTDGHLLVIVRGQGEVPALAKGAPETDGLPILVPAAALKEAAAAMPKKGPIALAAGPLGVLLVAGDRTAEVKAAENVRYPDVNTVVPTKPAWAWVDVNPLKLAALLKAAAGFSDKDRPSVRLLFWKPEEPLGVAAITPEGVTFDAILMPYTDPPAPRPGPRAHRPEPEGKEVPDDE